jgi:hypothetical protein
MREASEGKELNGERLVGGSGRKGVRGRARGM